MHYKTQKSLFFPSLIRKYTKNEYFLFRYILPFFHFLPYFVFQRNGFWDTQSHCTFILYVLLCVQQYLAHIVTNIFSFYFCCCPFYLLDCTHLIDSQAGFWITAERSIKCARKNSWRFQQQRKKELSATFVVIKSFYVFLLIKIWNWNEPNRFYAHADTNAINNQKESFKAVVSHFPSPLVFVYELATFQFKKNIDPST